MSNPYLKQLLHLQQDGREAISGPGSWRDRPFLEVKTSLHAILDRVAPTLLSREGCATTWLFLVGSPGNGKSTAVGYLYRLLSMEYNCTLKTNEGTEISEVEREALPYEVDIYEPERKYSSALLVQDASVVRDPYATGADPAYDLLETMALCAKRGRGLVVCTNRGVLERLQAIGLNDDKIKEAPWWRPINAFVEQGPAHEGETMLFPDGGQKRAFESAGIEAHFLDSESLIHRSDNLDELIKCAVADDKWGACSACEAVDVCPFKANRDWLSDEPCRKAFIDQVRRAEVWDGQIVVFREAVALLSAVLSGCPADYSAGDPCHWVKSRAKESDWFSLSTRRVYSLMYAGWAPFGLEDQHVATPSGIRDWQKERLEKIVSAVKEGAARSCFQALSQNAAPSTTIGLNRLLGKEGALPALDPVHTRLPDELHNKWDADLEVVAEYAHELEGLERKILESCLEAERALEESSTHDTPDAYWYLRRIISGLLLRRAAFLSGLSKHGQALSEFVALLEITGKRLDERTPQDQRRLRQYRTALDGYMAGGAIGTVESPIALYENVQISGDWVNQRLKVDIDARASDSVSIGLAIGCANAAKPSEVTSLHADVFVWLYEIVWRHLDKRCVPEDLLSSAMDAKIRTAQRSAYAFEENGVKVEVQTDRGTFRFVRDGGMIIEE